MWNDGYPAHRRKSNSDFGLGLHLGVNDLEDSVEIGEGPRGFLGVNGLAIDTDLKDTAAGRHELQPTDALLELQELGRQTDGLGLVVSSRAILDNDLRTHCSTHGRSLRQVKGGVKNWRRAASD